MSKDDRDRFFAQLVCHGRPQVIGWLLLALWLGVGRLPASGADSQAPAGSTPRILADVGAARRAAEKRLHAALRQAICDLEQSDESPDHADMITRELKALQAAWEHCRQVQTGYLYTDYYDKIGSQGAQAVGIWEYESRLIDRRIKELKDPPNFF